MNAEPLPRANIQPEMRFVQDTPQPRAVPLQTPSPGGAPTQRTFRLVNPLHGRGPNPAAVEPAPILPERPMVQAQPVAQSNPVPAALVPGIIATPQVTVEKRVAAGGRAGEPQQFYIVLRNVGSTPALQVRVEDEIPPGARVTFADPQPILQSDRAVWVIAALPPGGERQLKVEVQAQGGGTIAGATSVLVSATTGARTRTAQEGLGKEGLGKEGLGMVIVPPAAVPVGFPVVFEVQVTNQGKQGLTGLVLHGRLPMGLLHPAGKEIEADVGDLAQVRPRPLKCP